MGARREGVMEVGRGKEGGRTELGRGGGANLGEVGWGARINDSKKIKSPQKNVYK